MHLNRMKHFIISLFALLMSTTAFSQANGAQTQQFFQLPIIPDSIQNFQRRCDYMVTHYWDFCDLKKAFSSRDKMAQAFDTYLSFMPYSSADAVFASVDKFMKAISKKAEDVAFITELAEGSLYADTAQFESEELYMHFIDNALKVKKLDKQLKQKYQMQASILHNSQEGMQAPKFDFVDADGNRGAYEPDTTQFATVLMFTVPGSTEGDLAKLRLDADIKTNQLVECGRVKIYCMAVEEGNGNFSGPEGWVNGYAPTAKEIYDTRHLPMFYIVNSSGTILKKGSAVEPLLAVMQQLRLPKKKKAEATAGQ